jgi:hypothetical protein
MAHGSWQQPAGLLARALHNWSCAKCGWARWWRASTLETPKMLATTEGGWHHCDNDLHCRRRQCCPGRSRRADQRDVPYMGPLRVRSVAPLSIPECHARHTRSLGGLDAGGDCSLIRIHQCVHLCLFDEGLPPRSVDSGLSSTRPGPVSLWT